MLDNFSVKELKYMMENGTANLLTQIKVPIVRAAIICFGTILLMIWMLKDALSISQVDQLKQGIGSFFVIVAGLSFTLMVFHILRLKAAKKLVAEPVDAEIIREHLNAI